MPLATATPTIDVEFPAPFHCLFQPKRTKVLWGGRGGGRSWACARALLLIGAQRPIRVLCARELQNSIAESVHRLLTDQIDKLGLSHFYEIQVGKIIGLNGTTFSFEGIRNNTTKIKSYEGVDFCWVEEAETVSKKSWGILIPTIRKPGSEIWITFNPELETAYTYKRFVKEPSPNSFVVKTTWRDNPWFKDSPMYGEMEEERKRDYDSYLNIWEGQCLQMLSGVVFAKELRAAAASGRICSVPWDHETPVDTFWDLGRRDMTSIWFAQRVAMQWRVLEYYENSGEDITHYLKYCQNRPYVYGNTVMPHDAENKLLVAKRSVKQIAQGMGFRVQIVKRTNKKANAINAARIIFPSCYFDETQCEEGLNRLRRYKYDVENEGDDDEQLSAEPLHDENSNGADAFMTMGQYIKPPKAQSKLADKLKRVRNVLMDDAPGTGWMG
jgi:phage terminase large subunit